MAEDELLFEIELGGVDRQIEIDEGTTAETFDVRFTCSRPDCSMEVRVSFDVKTVTTLEVVPRAMAEMHRAFTVLAAQSAGWGEPGKT
ncbi:MAG: hypothetical protein WAP03_18770 [Methylorubrum rhodinum]|uniref:hypothetical protein n=1 Tax=Methylorubrum rhodinum TaxID=29428 RepID=UPI003BAF0C79